MADNLTEINFRNEITKVFKEASVIEPILNNTPFRGVQNYIIPEIAFNTNAMKLLGQGTFGEIYFDPDTNHVYKIMKLVGKINVDFQKIINECIIQIILSLIFYPSIPTGEMVRCAPEIYGFYRYKTSDGTNTFVIEMEQMDENAWSFMNIKQIDNTFYNFVMIVSTLNENEIFYNHCDMKLNNIMYDTKNKVRLIDFGYSSIRCRFRDTGRFYTIFTDECGWEKGGKLNEREHAPRGYYVQKDIIQFIINMGITEKYMSDNVKAFINELLLKYGLSEGGKPISNIFINPATKVINKMYNRNAVIRERLYRDRQDILQKTHPRAILSDMTLRLIPLSPDDEKRYEDNLYRELVYHTNDIEGTNLIFNILGKEKNRIIDDRGVLIFDLIQHQKYDILKLYLDAGIDPNRLYPGPNVSLLVFTIPMPANERQKYIKLLIEKGADINQNVTAENIPILYLILKNYNIPDQRRIIVHQFLQFNPDLTIVSTEGKTAIDYAKDTGDQVLVKMIEERLPRGGRRRHRQRRSHTKKRINLRRKTRRS
jgi:serine/threonine protein kinase